MPIFPSRSSAALTHVNRRDNTSESYGHFSVFTFPSFKGKRGTRGLSTHQGGQHRGVRGRGRSYIGEHEGGGDGPVDEGFGVNAEQECAG
ncbi:MAG: hypothetical protein OXM00_12950, partial [Paracoccaceae bacterium]|nr:hypothetical protein [Paracoccaceae bacterium]